MGILSVTSCVPFCWGHKYVDLLPLLQELPLLDGVENLFQEGSEVRKSLLKLQQDAGVQHQSESSGKSVPTLLSIFLLEGGDNIDEETKALFENYQPVTRSRLNKVLLDTKTALEKNNSPGYTAELKSGFEGLLSNMGVRQGHWLFCSR